MTENRRLRVMFWTRFGRVFLVSVLLALAAGAQELSCPAVNPPSGRDFRGQTIEKGNFSYRDLTNADFSNATLIAPYFAYANLTNANFQGATVISDNTNPALATDFSFANLEKTCFLNTEFKGPTYFTKAKLTCADFSKVDLSTQNVIFLGGDQAPEDNKLNFDRNRTDCRLAFRAAKMDCEFLKDWRYLDLTGADIEACASQFTDQDFSGAKLNSVNLKGANLNGTKFVRAELSQANLEGATLIGADLSYASLFGAHLDYANLTNASLYHAFLTNNISNGIQAAASLQEAHLRNANLSYAQLTGVNMTNANFYGDIPARTLCKTASSVKECGESGNTSYEGFACGCASAHGATLRQTNLSDAYLYGVDFTDATIQAADFTRAVLTGANLGGTEISGDQQRSSDFSLAFLQGTNLEAKTIENSPNLRNAFVDFRDVGNTMFILLNGKKHNAFRCDNCLPPKEQDICVEVVYYQPTQVPGLGVLLRCPDGGGVNEYCGPADENGVNKKWQSRITDLTDGRNGIPLAAYEYDSTYIKSGSEESACGAVEPMLYWPEQRAK
jgi:uncharacterized protein YjbI with pentapeptide repeats